MKPIFRKKVLENGLTILFEKRAVPVVSVGIGIRRGALHESKGEKGISHFIEHMLFKGTKTRSQLQIANEIEKQGGELNGFTNYSMTAFWCKMPSSKLNFALNVLTDMVKNSLFSKEELEKERQVIFEEMKMYNDNPMMYALLKIHEMLYRGDMAIPVIGTEKAMNSIDREKMILKFQESYTPNEMILVVVGDANFEKVVDFAKKNFSEKKKSKKFSFKIEKQNQEKIEIRQGIDQANMIYGFHSPLANDKKNYAAQVLSVLMGEGMSSRLFVEIREKRNLAYGVKSELDCTKDYSYTLIYVGAKKENVSKIKKLISEELKKVSEELTEKELVEIKEQMIGNNNIAIENSRNQMESLFSSEYDGNAKEVYEFEKNIKRVKLEDVKKLAKIASEKYSFFALVPK
jgi:predicted Zn-dependent peptidase